MTKADFKRRKDEGISRVEAVTEKIKMATSGIVEKFIIVFICQFLKILLPMLLIKEDTMSAMKAAAISKVKIGQRQIF